MKTGVRYLRFSDLQPEPLEPSAFGSRFTVPLNSILLTLLCVAGTACSTTALTGKILFEDPRGSVSLQTIANPLIRASHPINLEPALLVQLLTGLEIHERGIGPHRRVVEGFAGQPPTPSFQKIRSSSSLHCLQKAYVRQLPTSRSNIVL